MLLGARYYGAGVGRFWSVDPIRDDSNWYIYPANNPVSFVDPSGMTSKPGKGLTYPLKKAIWEVEFCKTTTIPVIGPPGQKPPPKITECVRLRCSGWLEVCIFYAEGTRKEISRTTTVKGGQCVKIAYTKFET
jgi:hypothetical protein